METAISTTVAVEKDVEFYLTKHESPLYLRKLAIDHGDRFIQYRKDWDRTLLKEIIPVFPLEIEFEISNHCNLSCRMCLFQKHKHDNQNKKTMPIYHFHRVMVQSNNRLSSIVLGSGSEPLLHPKITSMMSLAKQHGVMDTILGTNGILLTPEISDNLIELQVARVSISLDAATKDTYKTIRGRDLLDQIETNIEILQAKKEANHSVLPYLRVTFCKQEENKHEADMFIDKWKGVADRVDIQLQQVLLDPSDQSDSHGDCCQPFQRLIIDYRGDVYPCCSFYKQSLCMGNILKNTISEIWMSNKINELRKSLLERRYNDTCKTCLAASK